MSTVIVFILVLGLLVFVHEFGHFIAAKLNGVAVEEFAIGFPPRLFSWKRRETEYSLNALPLGGYVKLKGEGGEFADEEDSFAHKKAWRRATILVAGVVMNLITAGILLSIGFMIGFPVPIDDGASISRFAKLSNEQIQIIQVLPESPAEQGEVHMGDVITRINGIALHDVSDVQNVINESTAEQVTITLQRGSESLEKSITPYTLPDSDRRGIGIALAKTAIVRYPIWLAPYEGFKRAEQLTVAIVQTFGSIIHDLFIGKQTGMQISGPVGIAVLTGEMAKLGIVYLIQFTAILSLNLAILNILPFPALDGSHLFFLIVEKIRGKRLTTQREQLLHTVGFAILMVLMIWVTYKDVIKYIIQ